MWRLISFGLDMWRRQMPVKSGVEGVQETLANLRDFPQAVGRNTLRRALKTAAQPVAVLARHLAPDDPATPAPDLKSSIDVSTSLIRRHRQTRVNEVEVYIGPTKVSGRAVLRYASNVEFGTFRAAPHPYLRPAWDRTQGIVLNIFARELTIEFEKAAARLSRKFFKLK